LFGSDELPVEAVPRRLTDRMRQRPSIQTFLPPTDLALWMTLSGHDPTALLQTIRGNADLLSHSLEALERIDDESAALTDFDGLTGHSISIGPGFVNAGSHPRRSSGMHAVPFSILLPTYCNWSPFVFLRCKTWTHLCWGRCVTARCGVVMNNYCRLD